MKTQIKRTIHLQSYNENDKLIIKERERRNKEKEEVMIIQLKLMR